MNRKHLAALLISSTLLLASPVVLAQNASSPQVSVVNLHVVNNADGSQSVITPKGDLAPLPGGGVNGGVAQIYVGAQGGFWYTDKTGQVIDLVPAVQALQARRARMQQAAQVPQYAPNPYEPVPVPVQQQQQSSSSGGGSSALGTAAAAGLGAMAGSALTHNYYNAPYGTPMYYGTAGQPYYYNNGEKQNLEDLSPNQKAVLYNKHQINQDNQQAALQQSQANQEARLNQTQSNQQNRQQSKQENQANRQEQYNPQSGGRNQAREQQENYQKQQQWYQQQMGQNTHKWDNKTENPFVAQQGDGNRLSKEASGSRGNREKSADGGGANRERSAERGGRRGQSGAERAGGSERGGRRR